MEEEEEEEEVSQLLLKVVARVVVVVAHIHGTQVPPVDGQKSWIQVSQYWDEHYYYSARWASE